MTIIDQIEQACSVIEFSVNLRMPTLNELKRLNYRSYASLRWELNRQIKAAISGEYTSDFLNEVEPAKHCFVLFRRHSTRLLGADQDGLIGGAKPFIDCLVKKHKTRSPSGLGLIKDDSMKCLMRLAMYPYESSLERTDVSIVVFNNKKIVGNIFMELNKERDLIFQDLK